MNVNEAREIQKRAVLLAQAGEIEAIDTKIKTAAAANHSKVRIETDPETAEGIRVYYMSQGFDVSVVFYKYAKSETTLEIAW